MGTITHRTQTVSERNGMTTTTPPTSEELIAEFGSDIPAYVAAIRTERRGTDAIEKAITLILSHPDIAVYEALDITHALKTLNRRNR